MASKRVQMQRFIRYYRRQTGKQEVDMHEVAKFAAEREWPLPELQDPMAILAKQFTKAARQETRYDKQTGRPYRANQSFFVRQGEQQLSLWVDTDEATRKQMKKSVVHRREQMVGDACQLFFDADHWNRANPTEEPIQVPLDFTYDVEWRKNGPEENTA